MTGLAIARIRATSSLVGVATVEGLADAIEAYKARHAGPDFLDGPHFELI